MQSKKKSVNVYSQLFAQVVPWFEHNHLGSWFCVFSCQVVKKLLPYFLVTQQLASSGDGGQMFGGTALPCKMVV